MPYRIRVGISEHARGNIRWDEFAYVDYNIFREYISHRKMQGDYDVLATRLPPTIQHPYPPDQVVSFKCSCCHQLFSGNPIRWAGSYLFCSVCARTSVFCSYCGAYIPSGSRRRQAEHHLEYLCHTCMVRVQFCPICDIQLININELSCPDCSQMNNGYIHDHGYTPLFNFFPSYSPQTLFLGVELETDGYTSNTLQETANKIGVLSRSQSLFFMQRDGSLQRGFEITTHPATLEYHENTFPWTEITKTIKDNGGKSHNTETCGLHVHFNRDYLGSYPFFDDNLSKLIFIVEKLWRPLVKFSRRENCHLRRWAGRYNQRPIDREGKYDNQALDDIKGAGSRYQAVNIHSPSGQTIEIRIFRGTLDVPTLFSSLELVDFLVNLSLSLDPVDTQKITWRKLTKAIDRKQYPFLVDALENDKMTNNLVDCEDKQNSLTPQY